MKIRLKRNNWKASLLGLSYPLLGKQSHNQFLETERKVSMLVSKLDDGYIL